MIKPCLAESFYDHMIKPCLAESFYDHMIKPCLAESFYDHMIKPCLAESFYDHMIKPCLAESFYDHMIKPCLAESFYDHMIKSCRIFLCTTLLPILYRIPVVTACIFNQSGKLCIVIRWLHQKPTDLDVQCFQKRINQIDQDKG